jgi:hypothetical protein
MKKVIGLFLLLWSLGLAAQNVSGVVIDEKAHPLSFVTIANANAGLGTYSDDEGKFNLDIKALAPTDEIIFSHLGYVDVKMTAEALIKVHLPIQMKPKDYSLHEVVVKPTDAKSLLMDALAHIKDNYPQEFTKNHIIFKDYSIMTGERNSYTYFDFNMYLPSYLAKDSPRIYSTVNKYEMYEKKGAMFHIAIPPTVLLRQMYPEKIFAPDKLKENDFEMVSSSTTIDGEEYDVLEFKRIHQKQDRSVTGTGHVYINKKDKGIRFIDLHIYNEKSERFMLVAKMDTLNINIKVSFKKIEGKYMLDYISQTTYGSGKFFGKSQNLVFSTTAKVMDRETNLKMNEIVMRTDVDDIILKEPPKNIKEMKEEPDMK